LLDQYFNLYLVYSYSNISFTEEERADEDVLYDQLESSGFLTAFIGAMQKDEYTYLFNDLKELRDRDTKANASVANVLNNFINDLPKNAETAAKMVNTFNPEQYKAVLELAKNAGMRS